jgi:capsular exopolysaccharide synthesis family protein
MTEPSANGPGQSAGARKFDVRQAFWARPLLTFGAPVALLALTVAFILLVRPVYEAAVSVRIGQEKSGIARFEELSTLGAGREVFTEMAVLRSRSLAEGVVRSQNLQVILGAPARARRSEIFADLSVDTVAPTADYILEAVGGGRFHLTGEITQRTDQPGPFERPAKEVLDYGEVEVGRVVAVNGVQFTLAPGAATFESINFSVILFQTAVEDLQASLAVFRPDREADVVWVRYRGTDPELVQAVPNELAAHFLAGRQRVRSAQARGTVAFLAEQIDTLGAQLISAEETLRSFREQNGIVSIEAEASAKVDRLAQMQTRRDMLFAERDALGQLLAEVGSEKTGSDGASPYRKLMSFPTLITNVASAEMLTQLVGLENMRVEFLMTRTPADSDVILLTERIKELESQLKTMAETYWRGLGEQVRTLGDGLASFETELARIPAQQMTYARMGRQATILSTLYTILQTKQKEAEVLAAVENYSVRVIDPAIYPTDPIRPKPWLSLMVALAVGVIVGVGGAVVAEHLDRTVRDRGELQAATGAAVLGLIPIIRPAMAGAASRFPWAATGNGTALGPRLIGPITAGDPAAEAYRSLRTNITFSRPTSAPKALVFTSPMPGDGKSTTAANMALVLSQQGGRVLLVDADMRRGTLDEVFRETREPGLSNVLVGAVGLADATRTLEMEPGHTMDLITSGTRPPNPAELLSSEPMGQFLNEVNERYDTVVFDAPPLNVVTDAALLGTRTDGVVLVARAGVTEKESLEFAVNQIERVRAMLLGTVLNGVDERRQLYYGGKGARAHGYFDRS